MTVPTRAEVDEGTRRTLSGLSTGETDLLEAGLEPRCPDTVCPGSGPVASIARTRCLCRCPRRGAVQRLLEFLLVLL
jgi:hypothetical protein